MNTPWRLVPSESPIRGEHDDYDVLDCNNHRVFLDTNFYPIAPTKEQAVHIVKCVNAHDKMVEALREAVAGEDLLEGAECVTVSRKAWDMIRAALEGLE